MDAQPQTQVPVNDRTALLAGLHKNDIIHTQGGMQYAQIKRVGTSNVFKGKDLRTQRWHRFHSGHVKKIEKHMGESVELPELELTEEQLDELKNSTYSNYVKKAIGNMRDHQIKAKQSRTDKKAWANHTLKADNRRRGIERAMDKLSLEEVDLTELDATTIQSYRQKAQQSKDSHTMAQSFSRMRDDFKSAKKHGKVIDKRTTGIERANNRLNTEEVLDELKDSTLKSYLEKARPSLDSLRKESDKLKKDAKFYRSIDRSTKAAGLDWKAMRKGTKAYTRGRGIERAKKRLNTEEVEALEELKKSTMISYIGKAEGNRKEHATKEKMRLDQAKNAHLQSPTNSAELAKRYKTQADIHSSIQKKRVKGIRRAVSRLAKEEVENLDEKAPSEMDARILAALKKARGIEPPETKRKINQKKVQAMLDKKKTNEEVEQLQELSPTTLASYIRKAYRTRGPRKRFREKGMDRAGTRLFGRKRTNEEVENILDLVLEQIDLPEEQLQELKKSTYKRYVLAVMDNIADNRARAEYHMAKGNKDLAYKHFKKAEKRAKGYKRAFKFMDKKGGYFKEEVEDLVENILDIVLEQIDLPEEQLQELSDKTIYSYAKKNFDSNSGSKWKKRARGLARAAERLRDDKDKKYHAPITPLEPLKKVTKESFEDILDTIFEDYDLSEEQLQELKASTYNSYLQKAKFSVLKHALDQSSAARFGDEKGRQKSGKAVGKRFHGISRAGNALARKARKHEWSMGENVDPILETALQELQELKASSYGNYIQKAKQSLHGNSLDVGAGIARDDSDRVNRHSKKVGKRFQGIRRATNALVKKAEQ